jgi:hypothetical protein
MEPERTGGVAALQAWGVPWALAVLCAPTIRGSPKDLRFPKKIGECVSRADAAARKLPRARLRPRATAATARVGSSSFVCVHVRARARFLCFSQCACVCVGGRTNAGGAQARCTSSVRLKQCSITRPSETGGNNSVGGSAAGGSRRWETRGKGAARVLLALKHSWRRVV